MTEWRALPGFPGYEVSDEGDVRSWRKTGGGTLTEPRTLRPHLHPTGYLYVAPRRDGRNVTIKNHHAVAYAFLGPRPEGQEVRHLDGNKTNNRVSSLQYGTRSENMRDALRHGTHNQASKTRCPRGHEYDTHTPRGRHCSTCMRGHRRAYWQRKKEAQ